ncbi:MAG: alpha-ketoacid dehydrogenase subunit beta [Candidatus Binatia bacterium]
MKEVSYIQSINDTLHEEMERDPSIVVIGEDVAIYGGVFKATYGLLERFGEERVIDSPLAESVIIGASVGVALAGLRPVPEIQFADFISPAFDQLVQQAAKLYWRTNGTWKVPMAVRCPYGGGVGGGAYHSQSNEAWFIHVPGLIVLAPSTAYDAKGLLKAAIRCDDPVLYFEHKKLYRSIKGEVPEEDYIVPLRKAAVAREGKDVTVITFGLMFHRSLEAAENLSQEGIDVEVIDLRTLSPLDKETIFASVGKTRRAVIVYEAPKTGGIGAEIAAILSEELFWKLDAPIRRVAGLDTPFPFPSQMENFYLPSVERIMKEIKDTCEA